MSKDANNNVPFQVQNIIDSMLNGKDNVYVRGNYRSRLDIIRSEIDKAIKKYDNEVFLSDTKGKKRA
jgi:Fic family protein